MGRRTWVAGSVGIAAVGLAALGWWILGQDERAAARLGRGLAAGLERAAAAAERIAEPHRCARWPERTGASDPPETQGLISAGYRWRRTGHRLALADPQPRPLTIGVVADARGGERHLAALRQAFVASDVRLVVSLGGMGRERDPLIAILRALAQPERWPVLAMPGDRESVVAHRAAVAALSDAAVVDGSRIRIVEIGRFLLATLPGAPHAGRLSAGRDGCLVTAEDGDSLAAGLAELAAEQDRIPVILAHSPPRQSGVDASDRTGQGIHIGEPWLTRTVNAIQPMAVVHGLIAPPVPAAQQRGQVPAGSPVQFIAAGAADGLGDAAVTIVGQSVNKPPRATQLALIVTLESPAEGDRVRWQRLFKSQKNSENKKPIETQPK